MDEYRVKQFLDKAENRSYEDLCQAVLSAADAIKNLKISPTFRTPDIKMPDIQRNETIVINFPAGLIWLLMASPYVVILGFAIIFKFLPKLAIMMLG